MTADIRVTITLDQQIAPYVQAAADRAGVTVEAWTTHMVRKAAHADALAHGEVDPEVVADLDEFHDWANRT